MTSHRVHSHKILTMQQSKPKPIAVFRPHGAEEEDPVDPNRGYIIRRVHGQFLIERATTPS